MFVLLSFTFGRWMRANEMPLPDRETELKRFGETGEFESQAAVGKTQNLEKPYNPRNLAFEVKASYRVPTGWADRFCR